MKLAIKILGKESKSTLIKQELNKAPDAQAVKRSMEVLFHQPKFLKDYSNVIINTMLLKDSHRNHFYIQFLGALFNERLETSVRQLYVYEQSGRIKNQNILYKIEGGEQRARELNESLNWWFKYITVENLEIDHLLLQHGTFNIAYNGGLRQISYAFILPFQISDMDPSMDNILKYASRIKWQKEKAENPLIIMVGCLTKQKVRTQNRPVSYEQALDASIQCGADLYIEVDIDTGENIHALIDEILPHALENQRGQNFVKALDYDLIVFLLLGLIWSIATFIRIMGYMHIYFMITIGAFESDIVQVTLSLDEARRVAVASTFVMLVHQMFL
ncbi:hypothetical protein FGO68_gene2636 [Halteria grandinella]|uniref:Uncharacterized protein n=1 Tax=Halteria grandinella TaxID=5974 RepID=A0A8J8NQ43_HALGN|nr:hypothetical protein FGO68_gene2636 [Halteria grandinella]